MHQQEIEQGSFRSFVTDNATASQKKSQIELGMAKVSFDGLSLL
jgi:hypothetical protein